MKKTIKFLASAVSALALVGLASCGEESNTTNTNTESTQIAVPSGNDSNPSESKPTESKPPKAPVTYNEVGVCSDPEGENLYNIVEYATNEYGGTKKTLAIKNDYAVVHYSQVCQFHHAHLVAKLSENALTDLKVYDDKLTDITERFTTAYDEDGQHIMTKGSISGTGIYFKFKASGAESIDVSSAYTVINSEHMFPTFAQIQKIGDNEYAKKCVVCNGAYDTEHSFSEIKTLTSLSGSLHFESKDEKSNLYCYKVHTDVPSYITLSDTTVPVASSTLDDVFGWLDFRSNTIINGDMYVLFDVANRDVNYTIAPIPTVNSGDSVHLTKDNSYFMMKAPEKMSSIEFHDAVNWSLYDMNGRYIYSTADTDQDYVIVKASKYGEGETDTEVFTVDHEHIDKYGYGYCECGLEINPEFNLATYMNIYDLIYGKTEGTVSSNYRGKLTLKTINPVEIKILNESNVEVKSSSNGILTMDVNPMDSYKIVINNNTYGNALAYYIEII